MYTHYVLGLVFSQRTAKVLLQQANFSEGKPTHLRGRWNGIGGKVKQGESPVQAMVRESHEETGLRTDKDDWLLFHYQRRYNDIVLHCYTTYFDSAILLEGAEPVAWFNTRSVVSHDEAGMVYNIPWMVSMAETYLLYPEHRYLEG